MVSRHALIYITFLAIAGAIAVLGPRETHSALPVAEVTVPPEALEALRQGRYLRASLILREYLAEANDTTAGAILLAARAEAGWGAWERVRELLEGRSWLDSEADGYGWNLLGRSQLALGDAEGSSSSLARYLALVDTGDAGTEQGIALLRQAGALAAQARVDDALVAYDRAAEVLPQVEDWISIAAAEAAAEAGDTMAVRERLALADSAIVRDRAWRTPIDAAANAGDTARALVLAERAAERTRSDSRRAAAWTLIGSLRAARGDVDGARVAYVRAMNTAESSSAAVDAARAVSEMDDLTAADQLLIGRIYLRHGNVARAVNGLDAWLEAGLGTAAERRRVRYDIANAYFRAGNYDAAEKALLAFAENAGSRGTAADALYTAGRAQYRAGRDAAARATLLRIVEQYADQDAAVRAAYLTADLDHDRNELERASEFYRTTIRLDPRSDLAALSRMRLAGIAYTQGRYDDALREFEEYRTTHRTGSSHQQATYWSGRALMKLGRTEDARARFVEARRADPFSYYGGLATDELDDDIRTSRLAPEPTPNTDYDDDVQHALARVDLLREIGWDDAAHFEMDRVRSHFARFDGALYSLAEALNERGFTTQGIGIGWDIFRREGAWNPRLLRIVYPFPFRDIILAEARDRDVDPYLAAALIRQESMFNPRALSPAGALGLMQVMPNTGSTVARSLGVRRFSDDMLTRPEVNVHLGMAYLADQLRSYDGRLDAVLAAYNAGPTRVDRWQEFPEYDDRILFAERIPYEETRDYVRIVQNNRRMYATLYPDLETAAPDE